MFHKAINLEFLSGTSITVTFQDGNVKEYDMKNLFSKYPQLKALENRNLFLSGRLQGSYGIVWTDELDVETETIYEEGKTLKKLKRQLHESTSSAVISARAHAGLSQKELSLATGISQADISRLETGISNPSVSTLERIAEALGAKLKVTFIFDCLE